MSNVFFGKGILPIKTHLLTISHTCVISHTSSLSVNLEPSMVNSSKGLISGIDVGVRGATGKYWWGGARCPRSVAAGSSTRPRASLAQSAQGKKPTPLAHWAGPCPASWLRDPMPWSKEAGNSAALPTPLLRGPPDSTWRLAAWRC